MNKILLALDNSQASSKVVEFINKFAGADMSVVLLQFLDPVPPELPEVFGKTEYRNTEKEQKVVDSLRKRREKWLRDKRKKARAALNRYKRKLSRSRMPDHSTSIVVRESIRRGDLVKEILKAAKELECDTVAVGRHSFPWLKELVRRHVGDELVRKGQGLTIWVVE